MSQSMSTLSAPRTVDEYLRQLRTALEGAPPALIQDAWVTRKIIFARKSRSTPTSRSRKSSRE